MPYLHNEYVALCMSHYYVYPSGLGKCCTLFELGRLCPHSKFANAVLKFSYVPIVYTVAYHCLAKGSSMVLKKIGSLS